ncbi:MAG: deoxyribonuclease IV [Alphaproteobacteria bacterium]|nr:deoxyribonuclease IV [Alphaproteobacteria bacterium]
MLNIGCHLSVSKGFSHIAKEAVSINANTFQFFTRNPQGGKAKDWDITDIENYKKTAAEHHFAPIVAHAPYTLNPCSDNPQTREFAQMVFAQDLSKLSLIPDAYYNFHPGSHVGQGTQQGINMIVDLLNNVLKPEFPNTVLLETMSGKGSEIGKTFEELSEIISGVKLKEKLGVCMDTCHIFAAGYDIVHNLDMVLADFDKIIGLTKLKAVHLNDSLMPFASHKDRHAKIGEGEIGAKALTEFVNNPYIKNLPIILETPNEIDGYAREIQFLRSSTI